MSSNSSQMRTGEKLRRCSGLGPSALSAATCVGVPYPLWPDSEKPGYSLHHRLEAALEAQAIRTRAAIAVDHHLLRRDREAQQGTPHREHRRLQDVDAVDFLGVGPCDRVTQRALADQHREALTLPGFQRLGVGEAADRARGVEDDRCRDHGPGERPAPRLVDPRDAQPHTHTHAHGVATRAVSSSAISAAARSAPLHRRRS
jgi:hypothetical protein